MLEAAGTNGIFAVSTWISWRALYWRGSYYLTIKHRGWLSFQVILSGRRINDRMGEYVADCTISDWQGKL